MSLPSLQSALEHITQAIGRGKGRFALAIAPAGAWPYSKAPFVLAAGSIRSVSVRGGFIITIGMTREHLLELRELCDEALASLPSTGPSA